MKETIVERVKGTGLGGPGSVAQCPHGKREVLHLIPSTKVKKGGLRTSYRNSNRNHYGSRSLSGGIMLLILLMNSLYF